MMLCPYCALKVLSILHSWRQAREAFWGVHNIINNVALQKQILYFLPNK